MTDFQAMTTQILVQVVSFSATPNMSHLGFNTIGLGGTRGASPGQLSFTRETHWIR